MTDESRTLERERWRRAREIYAGAVERRGEARTAWLDEACANDDALRREVESLLQYETAAADFIETPVANLAGALGPHDGADSLLQRRIGDYTVTSWLGAGGMGDVYRAWDARLERDVAIKVLPRGVTDDARVSRFEREAQLLGALNHPNIATIHGFERQGDVAAIVLELVEGSTLAELVETQQSRSRARGVRLDQALRIALQIAEALESAHARGIVHRDLKPANVKVRSDGIVKVLDFGIAKMLESMEQNSTGTAVTLDLKLSHGIMGTPAYMSPEQARGEPVDKRTDIWAFGCVVYELLTGRQAFEGTTSAEVTAAVLDREPDMTRLPAEVPPVVSRLVQRCLRKDPQERLRDIGDAALEIKETLARPPAALVRPPAFRSPGWGAVAAAALAVGGVVAAGAWLVLPRLALSPPSVVRFTITPPAGFQFRPSPGRDVAISRDGLRLAYLSVTGIVVRSIDRVELSRIGPESPSGGGSFFLSPDGPWVGLVGPDGLVKIPAGGGKPVPIAPAVVTAPGFYVGASWGPNDDIVYADDTGLLRVPAEGGTPEVLLPQPPREKGEQLAWPEWLPGQRWVMFTVVTDASGEEGAHVDALNLESGTRKVLARNASRAQYVSSGHLVFKSQGAVHALPWDLAAMEPLGSSVAVVTNLASRGFAVSADGTLVYPSGPAFGSKTLVWVDRRGSETQLATPPREYVYPRLSPDETRVAIDAIDDANRDIWVWDFGRQTLDLFTVNDPSANPLVAWSPDGRHLAFGSERFGVSNLFLQSSDGTGLAKRLIESSRTQMPGSFTPDGRHLIFGEQVAGRGWDVLEVALGQTPQVRRLLETSATEMNAVVSPNGHWLAYSSDETGQQEVYVRSFPDLSRDRRKLSQGGGKQPVWSRSGRELFYLTSTGAMMSVPLREGPTLAPGIAQKLFESLDYAHGGGARTYDVARDGRFLMVKPATAADGSTGLSLTVVHNWFEELQRLAPGR